MQSKLGKWKIEFSAHFRFRLPFPVEINLFFLSSYGYWTKSKSTRRRGKKGTRSFMFHWVWLPNCLAICQTAPLARRAHTSLFYSQKQYIPRWHSRLVKPNQASCLPLCCCCCCCYLSIDRTRYRYWCVQIDRYAAVLKKLGQVLTGKTNTKRFTQFKELSRRRRRREEKIQLHLRKPSFLLCTHSTNSGFAQQEMKLELDILRCTALQGTGRKVPTTECRYIE